MFNYGRKLQQESHIQFLYICTMERSNGCIIRALFIHRHTVINIQTHFNVDIWNESTEKEMVLIIPPYVERKSFPYTPILL